MKANQPRNPAEDLAAAAKSNPIAQMGQVPAAMQQQPVQNDPLDKFRGFINQIAEAFKSHFFGAPQGFNGYTFAEFILSETRGGPETPGGRQAYGTIKETLGRAQFEALVQEHPSLWASVRGMPHQYKIFVDQFFGYDEWYAKQQSSEEPKEKVA